MEKNEIFEKLFSKKSIIETRAKRFESFIKSFDEIKTTNSDFVDIIVGAKGITSVKGTMSGLRDKNNIPFNKVKYCDELKEKWDDIKKKIDEIKTINFSNNEYDNVATKYRELCNLFPTEMPNNITNRLMCMFLPDKLVDIVNFDITKDVLKFIGEDNLNEKDSIYWLPYNMHLYNILNNAYTKSGTNSPTYGTSVLGWLLVEYMNNQNIIKLLENNYNLILTGAPGTGKTYLAREIANAMGASQDSGRFEFVQFHPSYDYTDFVEGLRPKQVGDNVAFERKDGIFKAFCKKAAEDTDSEHKYVFVIDEINRGEISKIFGELFFSIDPGYRGEFDKDKISNRVQTQYQNLIVKATEKLDDTKDDSNGQPQDSQQTGLDDVDPFVEGFYIPKNVYVIGTMNDIDRSVESMDFAFRRRFAFYEVMASTEMLDSIEGLGFDIIDALKVRMRDLNDEIVKPEYGLSSSYQIGGAYFLKYKKYFEEHKNDKKAAEALWNNHLKGLLFEYFRGLPPKEIQEKMDTLKKAYDNDGKNKTKKGNDVNPSNEDSSTGESNPKI